MTANFAPSHYLPPMEVHSTIHDRMKTDRAEPESKQP